MQSRSKWWIITIIALFVLSFLYAFQPLRLKPKEAGVADSVFRYTFAQPLVQDESQLRARADEIDKYLTGKGLSLYQVQFKEKNVLEIETNAMDEAAVEQDRKSVLAALTEKYPGVQALAAPDEQEEQPVAVLGPFAVYRPRPQVKLGLDLLGGAHVVLRCLPETTLTFTAPEDRPLVKTAAATPTPAAAGAQPAKPVVEAKLTPEDLADRVRSLLVRSGTRVEGTDDLKISFPASHLMMVQTRAANQDTADKQQKLISDFLGTQYPGVTITAANAGSVFLEGGGPGKESTAEKVMSVIDRRLYEMSEIREPVIQTQGIDRVIVELPGVSDPERVVAILKSTAMLEFRLIPDRYEAPGAGQDEYEEWRDKQTGQMVPWERVMAESQAEFTGRDLMSNATVSPDSSSPGRWVVNFEIKADRKQAFREFTRRNIGKLMAIVLDGKPQMAPVIRSEIPGSGQIEGSFGSKEAGDLKLLLNAGALPVPLEIAENRTISATLGTYAIQRSLLAGVIGLSLVVVFMFIFYRLPGLLANVALALYVLIVLAVVVFTKTTLTLPGIAGIILSIGMAVDANILIFERLKEEVWSGKSIRAAIDAGFERAWTAILDSNINSLIVAAVLYFLGSSSIKSFAVTLFVGVVCSLFTAVTVSRWMVTMAGTSKLGQKLHLFGVAEPTS
jgi:protein-export membrane protein SecD